VVSTDEVSGTVDSTEGAVVLGDVLATVADVPVDELEEHAPARPVLPSNTLAATNERTLLMPKV
jgi:hypothetical protein